MHGGDVAWYTLEKLEADTPAEADVDLPHAGERVKEAVYTIHYLKTKRL